MSVRALTTSEAIQAMYDYAERVGVSMSHEQCLELVTRYQLYTTRELTRSVALIHAFTTSQALDDLPLVHGHGSDVLRRAPSMVLSYVLSSVPTEEREVLLAASFLPDGIDADALCVLFPERSPVMLMKWMNRWVHRRLLHVDEAMVWRVPEEVVPHLELVCESEMVHALVLAHVQWCVQRFPSDPLGFYETFPPPARSGRIWAHREELLGLIRRCVSRDAEAAGRIMLVLAPAALALGGRDALDELSTHLDLCVDSLEHCDAHFHLLLIKAELMFRRSGHLIDTMALFEQARRQYLDQASPKRPLLELCLASRETTLAAFRGLPAQEVMRLAQHVWQLVEDLNVPDFFAPQALRLIHNAHKELGEVDQAISCVERALELATSRHLPQTAMLCKLSLMASLMDLERIVRARSMGQELLLELDPAHSPRMYFFAKFLLGYMLYGEGELGEASMHLEQAREYMASSHDTHSLLIIHQLLALTELELGRVDKALDWQYRVGWPLMNSARQPMNSSWWVALIGALVYAWCNESFSAQRMLLDARAYACRHEMPGDPWVLEWVDAMCAVILAVQNKSETFPVEQALMALDAVRKTYATRTHFYDQLVRVVSGVERFCERWLNAHGHTLEREPTLHVDVLDDPSCFALPPGATVSLTRRQSMRRILGALITHHRQGATLLCMEELFAIGWPGEVATSDSMSARVYNTLSRMRKLGLDALILHNGDGYMLDPSCLVVCDQDAPGHDGQVSSQR